MSRYLEFQNGVAVNELLTSGVPEPPVERFMVDVTGLPGIHVGWTVSDGIGLTGVVDASKLIFVAPVLITVVPTLSTLEQTVNRIAIKVGA